MSLNKILLVDDDKAFNFLNRIILAQNKVNCAIDEALDGRKALEYIAQTDTCPDVILLDINMPQLDGFEFLQEFEKRGKCCGHTKIFMLTSSIREEDKQNALNNKLVTGFLDKPLTAKHIDHILTKVASDPIHGS